MRRTIRTSIQLGFAAAVIALGLAQQAEAGPPLICHEFQTGGAGSLPWGEGTGWNTPSPRYDVNWLAHDTLRLLTPQTPLLGRMETMRRATIYASKDPRAAHELMVKVLSRVLAAEAAGTPDPVAWFDAGYLVESYRQASLVYRWDMLASGERADWKMREAPAGLDGYAWVRRALQLSGSNPEMEFAASLMKDGALSEQHLQRARAGAREGSLLARQLAALGHPILTPDSRASVASKP